MQRDRARERMERAKRQWELEHASDTCIDGKEFEIYLAFQFISFSILPSDERLYI